MSKCSKELWGLPVEVSPRPNWLLTHLVLFDRCSKTNLESSFSPTAPVSPLKYTKTSLFPSTGIALLYLHLHNVFNNPSCLHKALEYVEHSLRCLTRRHDITFLCGDTGPLAVAAVVYHRLQRVQETDECINRPV